MLLLCLSKCVCNTSGLIFNLNADKQTSTRSDGATLTCRASIEFPSLSNLSCIHQEMHGNSHRWWGKSCYEVILPLSCAQESSLTSIEQELSSKVGRECGCNFKQDNFHDSSIQCSGDQEIVFMTSMEYSSDDIVGTKTASVITERIIEGSAFLSMSRTRSDQCLRWLWNTSLYIWHNNVTSNTEAAAAAGIDFSIGGFGAGMFTVGFLAAVLIIGVILLIIM